VMAEITYREAVIQAMAEEMRRDDTVFLIGEDVGPSGGIFKCSEGLFDEFGADRVIDAPITEAGYIGLSVGAAVTGMRPIAELMFGDFSLLTMDQIVNQAAKIRYMTGGQCRVPLTIRLTMGAGRSSAAQHSQSLHALFAHIPGLKVALPSCPRDAKGLLKSAIRDNNPVLFFEHKRGYSSVQGEVPEDNYVVPIGQANLLREGEQISLISYGLSVRDCLEAAQVMEQEGVDCEVVDLRTISPLDKDTVLNSVRKTGKVCIVHEDNLTGGVGAELAAIIAKEAFGSLDGPIHRVAAPDIPSFPYNPGMEEFCLPSVEDITKAIRELAAY